VPVVVAAFAVIGLLGLAVLAAAVAVVAVVPELRWRRWAYDIGEDRIDLRHGTFAIKRTVVPIRRVQHVETETGPLQGVFDLASVRFHTAAGAVAIPALERVEADRVRTQVAERAQTLDDV
jgi:membrane protein YdbS with pleckstrin-like domain